MALLFGLALGVTLLLSLSVANADRSSVHAVTFAALPRISQVGQAWAGEPWAGTILGRDKSSPYAGLDSGAGDRHQIYLPLVAGSGSSALEVSSPQVKVLASTSREIVLEVSIPPLRIKPVEEDGVTYQRLYLPGAGTTAEIGRPELPTFGRFIAVPVGAEVEIDILEQTPAAVELGQQGEYTIVPAQPPDIDQGIGPLSELDVDFYAQDGFYPLATVSADEVTTLRGVNATVVRFYPVQFNPARGELRVLSKLRVRVTFSGGEDRFVDPRLWSPYFESTYRQLLLNYPILESETGKRPQGEIAPLDTADLDGADLLIITHPDFVEQADTLAEWKRLKGILTEVRTLTQTGTTTETIRNYILNAYNTWNPPPSFVLLLGDAEFIPVFYETVHFWATPWWDDYPLGAKTGTDLYYADMAGNYYPELAIGRMPVDTAAQAALVVSKTVNYERFPPTATSFFTSAMAAGYFQDHVRDSYEDTRFIKTLEEMRDFLRSRDYAVDRVYWTWSNITPLYYNDGPHGDGEPLPADLLRPGFAWDGWTDDVLSGVNDGRFLIMHRDHGHSHNNDDEYVNGWVWPEWKTSDVASLTNGSRLPVVLSSNCETGWFDSETDYNDERDIPSLAEVLLLHSEGGAVGMIAATRGTASGYNDFIILGFIDAMWPDFNPDWGSSTPEYRMGQVLNLGRLYMAQFWGNPDGNQLTLFETYHYFGDPTMEIWTGVPGTLSVSHPLTKTEGGVSLTVDVVQDGALVSLVQGGDIMATALSADGQAILDFGPASIGAVSVTVTKHDYAPYEGSLMVVPLVDADLDVDKAVDRTTANEGDSVTYVITVTNNGPDGTTGVVVRDGLPDGVSYLSDDGEGAYESASGAWNVGGLETGIGATLRITVAVDPGTAGWVITNTGVISASDEYDTVPHNNAGDAAFRVIDAELALIKSADYSLQDVGDTFSYAISVTNNGPDDATGVVISDVLPAGVTFDSSSVTHGSYDSAAGAWTVGDLDAGDGGLLAITVTVDAGTLGWTITNTALISDSKQGDSDGGNNQDKATIWVTEVDLALSKGVDDETPDEGQEIVYTLQVANDGPGDATGVVVRDTLPAGVTYASDDGGGTYKPANGAWSVGDIGVLESATLHITVTVDAGTAGETILNTAAVNDLDQADTIPGNDAADIGITVTAVDLAMSKGVDDEAPDEGQEIVYTLKVTNDGPDDATGVVVSDLLPGGVSYVDDDGGGAYEPGSGAWSVGKIDALGSATLHITAMVDTGTAGQTIVNAAAVSDSDQADTDGGNDTAEASVTVTAIDLAMAKGVDDEAPDEGQEIVYTLQVVNNGPDDATGVVVSDLLPGGVSYADDDGGGAYEPGSGAWSVGEIGALGSATLHITVTVDAGMAGETIVNGAVASDSDQADINAGNDDAEASVTVTAIDLALSKGVDDEAPDEGQEIVYTLQVTNNGPDDATGVVVSDLLPGGVSYVDDDGGGTYGPGAGVWLVGEVSALGSETLHITAIVDAGMAGETIANTAVVTDSDQADTDGGNDEAGASITVTAVDLAMSKAVDDEAPDEGQEIVYTLVVTNNGPDDATGVVVSDLLPDGVSYADDDGGGAYEPGSGAWSVGGIGALESGTLHITVTVDAGTAAQTIVNTAAASDSDQADTDGGNDGAEVSITVTAVDLALSKGVDKGSSDEGQEIVYTLEVVNNGPDDATGVVVSDRLPGGVHHVGDDGLGAYDSSTGIWTVGALGAGLSSGLRITATVDQGMAGQMITNTAAVSDVHQADTDPGNDEDEAVITVTAVDMAMDKTVDDEAPDEGQEIVYTLEATNNGFDDATGVVVSDVLPKGVTCLSDDGGGAYSEVTGVWLVGQVGGLDSAILHITATVDAGTAGETIVNTTVVSDVDQADIVSWNDDAEVSITVTAVDLAVAKAVDDKAPDEGQEIVYTLKVINNGPDDATEVVVSDLLPDGVTYASDDGGGAYEPGSGIWNAGEIGALVSATLHITATVDAGTAGETIVNGAAISHSDQADTDPENDDAEAGITVTAVDLALSKGVDDEAPDEGEEIVYTLQVLNNGPDGATGVVVSDLLPEGVSYVGDDSLGAYDSSTGVWTIETLDADLSRALHITATVDAGTAGETVVNMAVVSASDQADTDPENDDAEASITVTAVDLALSKGVDDEAPDEGQEIVYTLQVANDGPDDATGVAVSDLLPEGVTYASDDGEGAYELGAGIWNVGEIGALGSATLHITATVDAGTSGDEIVNTGVVSASDQADTNAGNDQADAAISVTIPVDLAMDKGVDVETPFEGDTVVYTLRVTNHGSVTGTGVVVSDTLPGGVSYHSDDGLGLYDSSTGAWTVGEVGAGSSRTLHITTTVVAAGGTVFTNTAVITGCDLLDLVSCNDADSVAVAVREQYRVHLPVLMRNGAAP